VQAKERISELAVAAFDGSAVFRQQSVAVSKEVSPRVTRPVQNRSITVACWVVRMLFSALARQIGVEVILVRDAEEAFGVSGIEVVH